MKKIAIILNWFCLAVVVASLWIWFDLYPDKIPYVDSALVLLYVMSLGAMYFSSRRWLLMLAIVANFLLVLAGAVLVVLSSSTMDWVAASSTAFGLALPGVLNLVVLTAIKK